MNSKQTPNTASNTATELHILDLFEEVARMAYVFRTEYEEWALGHRTDLELGTVEKDWMRALQTLNDRLEAEVANHRQARRGTRARYLAEQHRADQDAKASAETKKYTTIGDLNLNIGPLSPAEKIAEQLRQFEVTVQRPDDYGEFLRTVNGIFGRAVASRLSKLGDLVPMADRSTWLTAMLQDCPCVDCRAELKRRAKADQPPVHDPDEEGREPTFFNPYEL